MRFNRSLGAAERLVIFTCAIVGALQLLFAAPLRAQAPVIAGHGVDHEHDHLHFSHPLVTESPSPDTKLRLDVAAGASDDPAQTHATALRIEAEYGFTNSFSVALVVPFTRVTAPRDARASSIGSVELSAKAASFAWAESGALLGGGLSVDLPTGSDAKGIGSGHLVGLAPFADAAIKRGNVESVAMLTYSTAVNKNISDTEANAFTLDASVLWRVVPQIELLAELTTSHFVGTSAGNSSQTFFAPGLKWRPEAWPKLALGVSVVRGVGSARDNNAVQASAFWHF